MDFQLIYPLAVMSIGIAIADPSIEEALEQLIKRADEAMYHAKQGGKNRYVVAGLQTPPSISTHTESGD